jgi:phytoene dehydrogenase-like protein
VQLVAPLAIARFAPEFRDCVLARSISPPAALERWNPNLIGGDILGGAMNLRQLLSRPTPSLYRTPRPGLYLCGASTPPGGGGEPSRAIILTAVEAVERGAKATAQMKPRLGRSSYLGDRVLGHPDPGAKAVAIWLRAASEALFPL